MERQQIKAYFCPFAGQVCQGGITKEIRPVCQFWDSDYSRCSLKKGMGGLRELGAISSDLQTLASK